MARTPTPVDHDALGVVLTALSNGDTLRAACALPGAPSWHVLAQWRRNDESLDWAVRMASRRTLPGCSYAMARVMGEQLNRKKAGQPLMLWAEIERRIRDLERTPIIPPTKLGDWKPLDPENPEYF